MYEEVSEVMKRPEIEPVSEVDSENCSNIVEGKERSVLFQYDFDFRFFYILTSWQSQSV